MYHTENDDTIDTKENTSVQYYHIPSLSPVPNTRTYEFRTRHRHNSYQHSSTDGQDSVISWQSDKISYTNAHDNHKATETCAIIDAYDTPVHKQLLTRRTNVTNTEVHGSIRAQNVNCTLNISTRTMHYISILNNADTNDTNIQKSDISKLSLHSNNRLRGNKTSTNTRTALTTPIPLLYSQIAMLFICNREIRTMH